MIIVQGTFRMDPADREGFLAGNIETMHTSRAEKGCLEYVFAADPIEPDRVVLSERWESRDDLDAHVGALTRRREQAAAAAGPGAAPGPSVTREVTVFDAVEAPPLG